MNPSESAAHLPVASPAASVARGRTRQRVRKRFWLCLLAALAVSLPLYPPAWHAALKAWLTWQAHQRGCDVSIASVEGGVFDTTQIHGLRFRQHGLAAADGDAGTDLRIARADLTLAWTIPWFQRPAPSWVRSLVLEGVDGRCDLGNLSRAHALPLLSSPRFSRGGFPLAAIPGDALAHALGSLFPSLGRFSARLVPESFLIRAADLRLNRGRYHLHTVRLWLSGSRDDTGRFLAREVEMAGPGFENRLLAPHSETYWKGSRLTLGQLALAPGVTLDRATLDGTHLDGHRLDWECKLTALGGEVRGQGAMEFSGERLKLEVAASLRGAEVRPLARLLGITASADGLIDQGNFSFRGDPENWSAAQMWLAAHATDFRWDKRRWHDLELQAVVVNRRVQVHRLELRQSRNRVSLTGECPLPPAPADDRSAADTLRQWREGGFSCQVDARLEDLRSLADLYGPDAPELDGRMSVNGALSAPPGARQDISGYLNVEGSRLRLRGAPLDFLRSTLLFRGGELRVADLQATHDSDYFTGTGSMQLDGPPRYSGGLRAEVRQLSVYRPALADLLPLADDLAGVTGLAALLRWDDSVLHFDECKGRFDGASCVVGGTMDLHDTTHPVLDLTLDGKNLTLHATNGPGRMQADCALTVRGRKGMSPTLGGNVRLLGGEAGAGLRLEGRADAAEPFCDLDAWLPDNGHGWSFDLDVAAIAPLRLEGSGTVTPLWRVTTGRSAHPEISGRLEVRGATVTSPAGEPFVAEGTVSFHGDPSNPSEASLLAAGPWGEAVLDGPCRDLQVTAVFPSEMGTGWLPPMPPSGGTLVLR